jgi:glutamate 5-kinase
VDEGCARALEGGASLLAAGVIEAAGEFERGDLVTVVSAKGDRVAQGLCEYSARDCRAILGLRHEAQAEALGYAPRAAVIHRDHLVLL